MNFLVDAQLPRRLARWIASRGHDVLHTLDLPKQNATPDQDVLARANGEARIVITKDTDFPIYFRLGKGPPGLLFVSTGNIPNDDLLKLFTQNETEIFNSVGAGVFVELTWNSLIIHQ